MNKKVMSVEDRKLLRDTRVRSTIMSFLHSQGATQSKNAISFTEIVNSDPMKELRKQILMADAFLRAQLETMVCNNVLGKEKRGRANYFWVDKLAAPSKMQKPKKETVKPTKVANSEEYSNLTFAILDAIAKSGDHEKDFSTSFQQINDDADVQRVLKELQSDPNALLRVLTVMVASGHINLRRRGKERIYFSRNPSSIRKLKERRAKIASTKPPTIKLDDGQVRQLLRQAYGVALCRLGSFEHTHGWTLDAIQNHDVVREVIEKYVVAPSTAGAVMYDMVTSGIVTASTRRGKVYYSLHLSQLFQAKPTAPKQNMRLQLAGNPDSLRIRFTGIRGIVNVMTDEVDLTIEVAKKKLLLPLHTPV